MTFLPQRSGAQRSPRVSLPEVTPAVVRIENGWRVNGKLQVVSLTGGLLSLSKPLNHGSEVKLMFVTEAGTVLGAAEMLRPLPSGSQPFKFTMLLEDDRRRLQNAIQLSQNPNRYGSH
jgi:hypothetical protein